MCAKCCNSPPNDEKDLEEVAFDPDFELGGFSGSNLAPMGILWVWLLEQCYWIFPRVLTLYYFCVGGMARSVWSDGLDQSDW